MRRDVCRFGRWWAALLATSRFERIGGKQSVDADRDLRARQSDFAGRCEARRSGTLSTDGVGERFADADSLRDFLLAVVEDSGTSPRRARQSAADAAGWRSVGLADRSTAGRNAG